MFQSPCRYKFDFAWNLMFSLLYKLRNFNWLVSLVSVFAFTLMSLLMVYSYSLQRITWQNLRFFSRLFLPFHQELQWKNGFKSVRQIIRTNDVKNRISVKVRVLFANCHHDPRTQPRLLILFRLFYQTIMSFCF